MFLHFISYLGTTISKMPSLVGSNLGGLVFTAILFIVTELGLWRFGDMKGRLGTNTLIGFAVAGIGWTLLFFVSSVLTIYDDHENLVGASARIKRALQVQLSRSRSEDAEKFRNEHETLVSEQLKCATQQGQNETLQKQNRDQQSSINGCLTQAMKLLAPEELSITPILVSDDMLGIKSIENIAIKTARIVILSNKSVTPLRMAAHCDKVIENTTVVLLGAGFWTGGSSSQKYDGGVFEYL